MLTNSQIRARAREVLGGKIFGEKWLFALLICLVSSAITAVAGLIPIAAILVAGPLAVGISGVFLRATRTGEKMSVNDMFAGFKDFAGNLVLDLIITLFTVLWTLLFIIPGIIKGLSYSMAFYIKNDHPEYKWKQCIEESKQMTKGHKGQLFCLYLSFIGWVLLGLLCFGVGLLWVAPYISTSTAEFYNQLKGDDVFANTETETPAAETLEL